MRPNDLYGLEAMVHPADVDDACPEWISAIAADGETYHKSGVEVVNGRDTVKYELPCYGETCRLWIDRRLHALVRRETKWNSTELRDIQELPPD
jgi:hypothetical protein